MPPPRSCQICGGRGGTFYGGRWIKCECVTGTPETRRLLREAHGAGARNPKRDAVRLEMERRDNERRS